MKRNKKGAIELSWATIIIIVAGVIILSLGLVWVRGVMQDAIKVDCEKTPSAEGCICEEISCKPIQRWQNNKECLDIPNEESICEVQSCDICIKWRIDRKV